MSSADARAVSNVVGFVLVFSLIIGAVSVVSVAGIDGLSDTRDAELLQNTERAFDILAHNIADVYRRSAPSRGTEIRLAGGRIGPGDPVEVNVTVDDGTTTASFTRTYRPIKYSKDDTDIYYSNTGVVRSDGDSATFVREPSFVLPTGATPNRTVIPIVATDTPGESIGGETTVLVRTAAVLRTVRNATGGGATVTVNVTSTADRAAAWNRYLDERLPGTACTYPGADPAVVSCTFDTRRVVVVQTTLDVVIEE